jgi:hypothetical protein
LEWVIVTHPSHPLHGQRVNVIRIRRGADPDLIIRMPDGYHGAIAASWTDYAHPSDPMDPMPSQADPPPLLSLDGLLSITRFVQHIRNEPLRSGGDQI